MDVCCCDVAVIKFSIKKGSDSFIRDFCSYLQIHVFTKRQQAIKMLVSVDLWVRHSWILSTTCSSYEHLKRETNILARLSTFKENLNVLNSI